MSNKVVFVGCSFTTGHGLDPDGTNDCPTNPDLWVNLCHKNIKSISDLELINAGQTGASNADIFINAVEQLSMYPIKYLICQWTSYPRHKFKADFELWSDPYSRSLCKTPIHKKNSTYQDDSIRLNGAEIIPGEYIEDIKNRLLVLHHHHHEICHLIKYINILHKICDDNKVQLLHINGLCHWDQDFFIRVIKDGCMPEDYTNYTKKEIIRLDYRTDEDAHLLYHHAHNDYDSLGGIHSDCWVNLYNSFGKNRQDLANDKLHPGKISNFAYFEMVKNYFDNHIKSPCHAI